MVEPSPSRITLARRAPRCRARPCRAGARRLRGASWRQGISDHRSERRQDVVGDVDDGHLDAEAAAGRRDLAADEAGPDDRDRTRRCELRRQAFGVVGGPEHVDPREVGVGQAAGRSPGGDEQSVEGPLRSVFEANARARDVERGDAAARHHLEVEAVGHARHACASGIVPVSTCLESGGRSNGGQWRSAPSSVMVPSWPRRRSATAARSPARDAPTTSTGALASLELMRAP